MVKTFHTMDQGEWAGLTNLFHPQHGSHYIDLPNGRILVATAFASEFAEEEFHARSTTKRSLPHPVFEGTDTITADHAAELGHLFQSAEEASRATVRDVVRKAAAIHPLMRLSAF